MCKERWMNAVLRYDENTTECLWMEFVWEVAATNMCDRRQQTDICAMNVDIIFIFDWMHWLIYRRTPHTVDTCSKTDLIGMRWQIQ